MATRRDLELARRLLDAKVLSEDQVRAALDLQARWLRSKQVASLEQALYGSGALPQDALALLDAPSVLVSQPFESYRLLSELGEGGSSRVFAGTYTPNGVPVAVKVLDPVHALRAEFRERFYAEARHHIEIEHENVVAGYEVGRQGGYDFYSMDLVEGATVLEVVERRGHLANDEALSITLQVARAMAHLHGLGLLHRDIKPGNVMVEASGRVRLIDLGLVARMRGARPEGLAEEALTVGTVEYLSPEQARGRSDIDARSDLYSLGMTLYHMVVGEVPFHGGDDYEVMAKQILAQLDAQKMKQRRIEPHVYFLIASMTAKDRDERPVSAAAVIRQIEGYLPGGVVEIDLGAAPPAPPVSPPPRVAPDRSGRAPLRRGSRRRRGR